MLSPSLLKLFDLFMIKFHYKQTEKYHKILGFEIQCVNYKQIVYCKMDNINDNNHIIVFIISTFFYNVGISQLIHKNILMNLN